MTERRGNPAIFVRCDPELLEAIKEGAQQEPFDGNVSLFARDAIRTSVKLRRLYGPRYDVVIADLYDNAPLKAVAA